MFSVVCHPLLKKGYKLSDFEDESEAKSSSGISTRVSDTEPFCGSYSVKNQYWIYHKDRRRDKAEIPVSASKNKFVSLI